MAQQQDVFFTTAAPAGMPGLAGPQTFAFVAGELVGGNPVKGAPYSGNAVTDTTQTLADGNRIVNHTTAAVYRDGEGRERREQSIPNIGPFAAQGAPPTDDLHFRSGGRRELLLESGQQDRDQNAGPADAGCQHCRPERPYRRCLRCRREPKGAS